MAPGADVTPPRETLADGTFVLDAPVRLPEILSLLIVGGGPFGTAVAFRAKELRLAALVIDHDDLMKRIRDYAKDKQILPDYGGGDRMQFPEGGELVNQLRFDPIDKDVMCTTWKALYRKFSVPAQVGVEFVGLESEGATWRVKAWNHNTKADQVFRAKHVVLGMGRGVPRQIEVSGDLHGMAFALKDASKYVGEPVCIIGGGTSAAEAVIAVSNAKAAAADVSAVYWSYRGDKLPKVSKALADVFFDAFLGNGNVRHLPNSEPVAVVGEGDQARLAIRAARIEVPGRPVESTHLEFRKQLCIACIGEDIPEQLLTSIGAPLVTGGPSNKKRIVVSPVLETRQPNVYLAGDILSPAYFETPNFDADPGTFNEVKRRGNIKSALRDGVLVAEAIAQKLAGRVEVKVDLKFADAPRVSAPTAMMPAVAGEPPVLTRSDCTLVSVLPSGVEANEFPLRTQGVTTIGRKGTDVSFPEDTSLSERHAVVEARADGYFIRAEAGVRGIYLQPAADRMVPLEPEMLIRAGRQWFVAGDRADPTSLLHHETTGQPPRRYRLKEGASVVGRDAPDITVAPTDKALSRRHLAIVRKGSRLLIKDLGSANGTFIQVDRPVALAHGDSFIIGQQVLRFSDERVAARPKSQVTVLAGELPTDPIELHPSLAPTRPVAVLPPTSPPSAPPQRAPSPPVSRPPAPPASHPSAPASAQPGRPAPPRPVAEPAAPPPDPAPRPAAPHGPSVFFRALGRLVPCPKGQTICEAAEHAGIKIDADCHQGVCGMDPVRVLEGAENLGSLSDSEKGTLEDLCSLKPGEYRLACMARVSGPVVIELVKQ